MTTCNQNKQNVVIFNHRNSKSDGQFNNLNLNQNHQNSFKNQSFSSNSSFSSKTFKNDYQQNGYIFDGRKNSSNNFLNQKNEWSKNNNLFKNSNDSNGIGDNRLSSIKGKTTNNKNKNNNSTLSLYIEAYEANIKAEEEEKEQKLKVDEKDNEEEITVKSEKNIFDNKKWRSTKRILTNGSLKYAYEIPRGNKDDDDKKSAATVPEVMQFKASQKLLNPNSDKPIPKPRTSLKSKSTSSTDSSSDSDKESVKTDSTAKSVDTIIPATDDEKDAEMKPIEVRVPYTMPGVLHYLQHEWSKNELKQSHWEMEKAELKARISFLQGERKGQENLKRDLVRRIKMLEYSLKQERLKIYRLTHNGEDPAENLDDDDKPVPVSHVPFEVDAIINEAEAPIWKRARTSLQQYMEELGYSEQVVSLRSLGLEKSYTSKDDSRDWDSSGSGQYSKSSDSDVLNKAFYGPKEDEDLVSSEAAKNKALPSIDENDANNEKEDDDGEDEESSGHNELDDALEALNQFSFLLANNIDDRDETEIDEDEEFRLFSSDEEEDDNDDDNGSSEAKEREADLIVANVLAVMGGASSSSPTTPTIPATSSGQDDEEEDEEDDIKNDSFLGDESEI